MTRMSANRVMTVSPPVRSLRLQGGAQEPGVLLELGDDRGQQVDGVRVALLVGAPRAPRAGRPGRARCARRAASHAPGRGDVAAGTRAAATSWRRGARCRTALAPSVTARSAMVSLCAARLTANVSNSGCSAAKCGPLMFQCATLIWLCRSRPSARRALSASAVLARACSGRWLGLLYMAFLQVGAAFRGQRARPRATAPRRLSCHGDRRALSACAISDPWRLGARPRGPSRTLPSCWRPRCRAGRRR